MVQFTNAALGLLISAGASLVAAAPAPAPTAAPNLANAVKRSSGTACTFTDASAVSKSKAACATIVLDSITVPAGETLDLTDLTDGTAVTFSGTTTFEYEEWSGPLVSVSGTDIVVTGASGNVLDGLGAKYWDGEGSNGGVTKPKFFYAHSLKGTSSITGINILNSPVQVFSVNSAEGLTLDSINIDNSDGDTDDLGHNTDAFDVGSSSNIVISNAVVKNQDDCLAINSGTGITFTGGSCSGGHGLSIGSVGGRSDNDVSDITISSSTISDSDNGVRIKTISGATGTVDSVTYKDITLSNIAKYGIVIEQDYENGSPTGTPTTGVPITNLTIDTVTGTVASGGVNIYILCGDGSCSDWTWTGVDITGGDDSSDCENIPTGASCSSSGSSSSSSVSSSSVVSSSAASSTVAASSVASSSAKSSSTKTAAASSSTKASTKTAAVSSSTEASTKTTAAASSSTKSSTKTTEAASSSTESSKSSSTKSSKSSSTKTKSSKATSTKSAATETATSSDDDTCE